MSCHDEHRSGRPNEVTTTELVNKIHKMVLDDRRLKVRESADLVGISKTAVHGWNMDPSLHTWEEGTVKKWIERRESAPKKAKTVPSAGKVMASVFWDARGIIFIDYLQKGKRINGDYYAKLLQRLSNEIKKKRPHLAKKKVLFNQDNAPVHTSVIAMAKINEFEFKLLLHVPYSPDLAPLD